MNDLLSDCMLLCGFFLLRFFGDGLSACNLWFSLLFLDGLLNFSLLTDILEMFQLLLLQGTLVLQMQLKGKFNEGAWRRTHGNHILQHILVSLFHKVIGENSVGLVFIWRALEPI